jgi:hypothetical protein
MTGERVNQIVLLAKRSLVVAKRGPGGTCEVCCEMKSNDTAERACDICIRTSKGMAPQRDPTAGRAGAAKLPSG